MHCEDVICAFDLKCEEWMGIWCFMVFILTWEYWIHFFAQPPRNSPCPKDSAENLWAFAWLDERSVFKTWEYPTMPLDATGYCGTPYFHKANFLCQRHCAKTWKPIF
jgi:hypothetical protein